MCTFGVLGRAPKAAGVSHDSPRAQTCTFTGPGLQGRCRGFGEKTPRDREKERKWGRGEGKKSAKFRAVRRRGVWRTGVQRRGGPTDWGPAEGGSGAGGGGPVEEIKKIKKNLSI